MTRRRFGGYFGTFLAALILTLLSLPHAASAHHGWTDYDTTQEMTLVGTIETVHRANPHATMVLKVAEKSWTIILAAPARLHARGIDDALTPGATVTVEGCPHKSKAMELRAERVVIDGKTAELR